MAVVSGTVYFDANRNGVRDNPTTEPGMSGISVQWRGSYDNTADDSGNSQLSVTDGYYQLSNVVDASLGASGIAALTATPGQNREITTPVAVSARSDSVVQSTGSQSRPTWVASGQFNGDGRLDLVVANTVIGTVQNPATVIVLLNQGNGIFDSHPVNVGNQPTTVLVKDFSKDGALDLAVGHAGSPFVSLLINDGNGNFTQRIDLAAGGAVPSIDALDVDGDNDWDLVGLSPSTSQTIVWRNTSTAGTVAFSRVDSPGRGGPENMVVAARLNSTGPPGLLVLDRTTNSVVRYNLDAQGYAAEAAVLSVDGGVGGLSSDPIFIAAGDLDGDQLDDLAVSRYHDRKISLYFNNGGQIDSASLSDVYAVWYPIGMTIADGDGDGDADVVINTFNSPPGALVNRGGRAFADAGTFDNNAIFTDLFTGPPVVADVDGDGVVDFAYSRRPQSNQSINIDFGKVGAAPWVIRTAAVNGSFDFGLARIVSTLSTQRADYDGDGLTNGQDLAVWRANIGDTSGPGMSADGNRNGHVDGEDFLLWQRRATISQTVNVEAASQLSAAVLLQAPLVAESTGRPEAGPTDRRDDGSRLPSRSTPTASRAMEFDAVPWSSAGGVQGPAKFRMLNAAAALEREQPPLAELDAAFDAIGYQF